LSEVPIIVMRVSEASREACWKKGSYVRAVFY